MSSSVPVPVMSTGVPGDTGSVDEGSPGVEDSQKGNE